MCKWVEKQIVFVSFLNQWVKFFFKINKEEQLGEGDKMKQLWLGQIQIQMLETIQKENGPRSRENRFLIYSEKTWAAQLTQDQTFHL